MMDEKIFRWMEIGKKISKFGLVPNLSHKFKKYLKMKKINGRFGLDPLSFLISVFLPTY
jgi:hypothetical protein